jgi:hypothetical protein
VFAFVFALVGGWPLADGGPVRWYALGVSVVILGIALIAPATLAPASRAWHRFGLLLHRIVNPLIAGLLYYVALTPMGLLMRAIGKDPLRLRLDPDATSYWIEKRPPGPAPETMSHQF